MCVVAASPSCVRPDDDHDDGGFGDDFGGDFGGGMDNDFSQDGGSLELIDEPTKVAKIDIHFERVAKKLDVKALKGAMWGRLQASHSCVAGITPTQQPYCHVPHDGIDHAKPSAACCPAMPLFRFQSCRIISGN